MIDRAERYHKITAFIGTVIIHILLLLLFILFVIKTPIPPFPESGSPGIEVNFGYSDEGMGTVLSENQTSENFQEQRPAPQTSAGNAKSEAAVVTSNAEESINIHNPEKPSKESAPAREEPKLSTELESALSKFKSKKNVKGNDGITGNPGNQGNPNGSNNTNNYNGAPGFGNGGDGTGIEDAWSLRGRRLLIKPELVDDSQETGIVVVEIKVDKAGNVIAATPGARGSTTTSAILFAKARQAAMKAKFSPSPDGIEEQIGTITFNFILK